jgi:hypothetical protein
MAVLVRHMAHDQIRQQLGLRVRWRSQTEALHHGSEHLTGRIHQRGVDAGRLRPRLETSGELPEDHGLAGIPRPGHQ